MDIEYKSFSIEHYQKVIKLWQETEGIVLSDTDAFEPIQLFLHRNPGLSSVAFYEDNLIGAILCSHDGRRGYLHHLAVKKRFRDQGIGSALVKKSIRLLATEGIKKCNIFILDENDQGIEFWKQNGFKPLPHFGWMQRSI